MYTSILPDLSWCSTAELCEETCFILVFLQNSLGEWLSAIGLSQYHQVLVQNGYENIDFITDITWEDLQEIGITKLGKIYMY